MAARNAQTDDLGKWVSVDSIRHMSEITHRLVCPSRTPWSARTGSTTCQREGRNPTFGADTPVGTTNSGATKLRSRSVSRYTRGLFPTLARTGVRTLGGGSPTVRVF